LKKAFWACLALLTLSVLSGRGLSIFAMISFAIYALWKGGLLLAVGYLGYRAYRKKSIAEDERETGTAVTTTTDTTGL